MGDEVNRKKRVKRLLLSVTTYQPTLSMQKKENKPFYPLSWLIFAYT